MSKRTIKTGFTNKEKYVEDGIITIVKTKTGFNHRLNYQNTQSFDFVPRLISDTELETKWEFIEGELLFKPSDEDLIQLAAILRKVHMSEIDLPKHNLRERVKDMLNRIHMKGLKIPEIEDNWREMNRILSKMGRLNPSHNDLWKENIIKDANNKLWLIDWEYATMGDKHFDLAYYIESQKLNKKQEEIFLNAYNSFDDYQAYIPEWMDYYKKYVNWLNLVWAYTLPSLPFDVQPFKDRINSFKK